jgi:2,3-diketo-5-methylthio-1-phosphopentane phosphatase
MIIFSDFDGTIAQNDVGDLLFQTFGNWAECERAIQAWLRGEISYRECLEREASTARVIRAQLETFCDAQPLVTGFIEFASFCRQNRWPLIVLSDGLDFYIHRILQRHQLDLPVFSNHLEFAPPDRLVVSFPHFEHSCGRCGNCKSYHVRRLATFGEKIIYVGDGHSDRCGAREAHVIFAKGNLAKWCEENRKPFWEFENFNQVLDRMQNMR